MKPLTHHTRRHSLSSIICALLAFAPLARADYVLSNAWKIATGTGNLDASTGNNANRGVAYSRVANQIFVANKTTTTISVFDGSTGALLGSANMTGVSGSGTFQINQVGVSDDGVLYGAGLTTAVGPSSLYKIYRWADWTIAPTVAYTYTGSDDATLVAGKRLGDNFAISGGGVNTLIMTPVGSGTTPTVTNLIFVTTDGTNFAPKVLYAAPLPALSAVTGPDYGVTFFTNYSYLIAPNNAAAYVIQYPANFASLTSPIAATVVATNSFTAGGSILLSYNAAAGLLAAFGPLANAAPASIPVNLYSVPPLSGFASALATTNTAHTNGNPNFVGGVALGGTGNTNYIYALDADNGLFAVAILFVPPQPPTISTPPAGVTGAFPPYTVKVAANGSKPLSYQWQKSATNTGPFSDISGANTNTYTITAPVTNYYQVVITNAIGGITSAPVLVSLLTPVTNSAVSQVFQIAAGTSGYSYLSADDNTRGIAYDTNSSRLVVASVSGGDGLYILNADNGTNIGTMNLSGAQLSGTKHLDQTGIADDGAVYSGNLALTGGGDAFHLTRWPTPTTTAAAYQAYNGDPGSGSGERWGDYMAVRGAGPSTQVLLGSKSGTNVALLTTSDGSNFVSSVIAISNAPAGFAGSGICFGAGNTLWAKNYLNHLYEIAFDPIVLTGGVVFNYANPSQIPSQMVGVAVDSVRNILAGVVLSDTPHDLELFQLTGSSDSPILFEQAFFASATVNGNANASIVMKYPRVYALDVNNGLIGLNYGIPTATAPQIVTPPADTTAYTNDPNVVLSVAASGSLPLFYQWRFNSNNIPNATNATYSLSNPSPSAGGYYDVIVHNIAGYATSAPPALLTIIAPVVSGSVTQLWTLAAGSRSYLDGSSYNTRGLAYDPNSGTVLVADHLNVFLLAATNGADLGQLNSSGLPSGGVNAWTVDQLGVADDGILYSCNLSLDGSGFAIVGWPSIAPGASAATYAFGGPTGADPSGSGDRWGDTMDVRGAGTATEILLGSANGTTVVVFDTADGSTFTPHPIQVTNVPAGFAGQGIAFGSNNTFWAKSVGYNLRQIAYDTTSGTGGAIATFVAGTDILSALCGIDVDVTNNILSGIALSDTPNDMRLYLLSGNTNPPALFEQAFFGSKNANSQNNAVTVLKAGKGFGLDVNNGLVALSYSVPAAPVPVIRNVAASGGSISFTYQTFTGRSYQVQYRTSLTSGSWIPIGSPTVASGPTATFSESIGPDTARFYRVVAF
jgi:hypothetical protein